MTRRLYHAAAFGCAWRSDIALPGFDRAPTSCSPPIEIRRIATLPDRLGGREVNRGFVYPDGIRLAWRDEVVFDMIDGTRIGYCPGPGWTGAMPASFSSSVAALTLAWRGDVPFHASVVELGGRAVVIAGPGGAGKSTLTAGLVAAGAAFVADDLAVLAIDEGGATVARGRSAIRLHPATAARLDAIRSAPVPGDPRGKWLVQPRHRTMAERLEIGAVLILGAGGEGMAARTGAARLLAHLFRRRWMNALPMRAALVGKLLMLGARVPLLDFPALTRFDAEEQARRAADAIALAGTAMRTDPKARHR